MSSSCRNRKHDGRSSPPPAKRLKTRRGTAIQGMSVFSAAPALPVSTQNFPPSFAGSVDQGPMYDQGTLGQAFDGGPDLSLAQTFSTGQDFPLTPLTSLDVDWIDDAEFADSPWANVDLTHCYDSQDSFEYVKPAGDVEYDQDFSDPTKLLAVRAERRRLFERIVTNVNCSHIRTMIFLYTKLEPYLRKKDKSAENTVTVSELRPGEELKDWTCAGTYYLERNHVTIPLKMHLKRLVNSMDVTTYRIALAYMQRTNCFDNFETKSKSKLTGPTTLAPVLGCNSPDALKKENNAMAPIIMGRKGWALYHAQRKFQQFKNGGSNKAEMSGGPRKRRPRRRNVAPAWSPDQHQDNFGFFDSGVRSEPETPIEEAVHGNMFSTEQFQAPVADMGQGNLENWFDFESPDHIFTSHIEEVPTTRSDEMQAKWELEALYHLQSNAIYGYLPVI